MRTRSSPSRERASGDRDGDTATGLRNHPADELRRRHGNRAIGRAIEARREDERGQEEATTEADLAPEGSGGRRLPPALRREMERAFDADFGDVRVHDAPAGTASASALSADAATDGTDIVAARRLSTPETPGDRLLLAHELAHVAQYRGHDVAERTGRRRADSAEREATQAAVAVAAGGMARVSETPRGDVATGVLDWLEEKAQDATSAVGSAASSTWGATKRGASAVWNTAESGVSAASNAASRAYGGMQSASNWLREAGSGLEEDIDWAQDRYAQGVGWVADQAEGIPGLEQAADAGAFLADQGSQLLAGGLQFGVTTGTDLASMVANPVDTVRGIESLAAANPFVGMPIRLGRAARQSMFQGVDPATAFGRAVDPRAMLREQTQLGQGMYQSFSEEYARSVGEDGDYLQAVGRGLGELLTTVGTGGVLGVGTKAGKLSKLSKVSRVTDTASDAAKGAKVSVKAPRLSRGRSPDLVEGRITTSRAEPMTTRRAMSEPGSVSAGKSYGTLDDMIASDGTFDIPLLEKKYADYGGSSPRKRWATNQTRGTPSDILERHLGSKFRRTGTSSSRGWEWQKARREFLRKVKDDPKQPSWVRGFLKNQFEQKGRSGHIKSPPGHHVGHPIDKPWVTHGNEGKLALETIEDNLGRANVAKYQKRLLEDPSYTVDQFLRDAERVIRSGSSKSSSP